MKVLKFLLLLLPFTAFSQEKVEGGFGPMKKPGYLNRWRIVGVNFSLTFLGDKNNIQYTPGFFTKIATSGYAKDKVSADLANTNGFLLKQANPNANQAAAFAVEAAFKPKLWYSSKILNYREIALGVSYFGTSGSYVMDKSAYTENNTVYNLYTTTYGYKFNDLRFNFSYLFNTRPINKMQTIAFYSGVKAYAGGSLVSEVNAYGSHIIKAGWGMKEQDTIVLEGTDQYRKPGVAFGVILPVGVKFNVSCHSNIFIEYNYNFDFRNFKGVVAQQQFKGLCVGYRYKFNKAEKGEMIEENPNSIRVF